MTAQKDLCFLLEWTDVKIFGHTEGYVKRCAKSRGEQ